VVNRFGEGRSQRHLYRRVEFWLDHRLVQGFKEPGSKRKGGRGRLGLSLRIGCRPPRLRWGVMHCWWRWCATGAGARGVLLRISVRGSHTPFGDFLKQRLQKRW
jgi:hypothetical protein